ncbi:hypothetical protein YC2023_108622 [Brassica napus]
MSQSTVRTHKGHLIRTSHIAQWDVIATHKRPCSGGTGAILDPQVTIKWDVTTLDKAISCLPRHLDPLRIGGGVTTPSFRPKTRFGGSIQAEDIVRWGVWLGRKISEFTKCWIVHPPIGNVLQAGIQTTQMDRLRFKDSDWTGQADCNGAARRLQWRESWPVLYLNQKSNIFMSFYGLK